MKQWLGAVRPHEGTLCDINITWACATGESAISFCIDTFVYKILKRGVLPAAYNKLNNFQIGIIINYN